MLSTDNMTDAERSYMAVALKVMARSHPAPPAHLLETAYTAGAEQERGLFELSDWVRYNWPKDTMQGLFLDDLTLRFLGMAAEEEAPAQEDDDLELDEPVSTPEEEPAAPTTALPYGVYPLPGAPLALSQELHLDCYTVLQRYGTPKGNVLVLKRDDEAGAEVYYQEDLRALYIDGAEDLPNYVPTQLAATLAKVHGFAVFGCTCDEELSVKQYAA